MSKPAHHHSLAGTEPFVRRVKIRNYKSIGSASFELGRMTVLVGRNGSGKSNCLDALRFVADALGSTLDLALRDRGGIETVRRLSTGHPRNFTIALELRLPNLGLASYGFEIAARKDGGFVVKQEQLMTQAPNGRQEAFFLRQSDTVTRASLPNMPPVASDRLYLVNAAGLPAFRPVFDALQAMGFYNLNPESMRALQPADSGEILHRDGSNISSVVARLEEPQRERIRDYLATITPDIVDVERKSFGQHETLRFRQRVAGAKHPWKFYASSMSDGTLRALGSLVAVTQLLDPDQPIYLVGIEEPETALHPAAAGALMDALREASTHTQVLITSHSPDLLDQIDPGQDTLLVVSAQDGETRVAKVDQASLKAIAEHLYTAGELLRMDQLEQDSDDLSRQEQLELFPNLPGEPSPSTL